MQDSLRDIGRRAEILDGIEGEPGLDFVAVEVVAVLHAAHGEVGPPRGIVDGGAIARADAGGVGLQEVDLV